MAAGVEYVLIISEVGRLRKEFQETGDIYISFSGGSSVPLSNDTGYKVCTLLVNCHTLFELMQKLHLEQYQTQACLSQIILQSSLSVDALAPQDL